MKPSKSGGFILSVILISIFLFCSVASPGKLYAKEDSEKTSELTIPWDEFKKLVDLDENEIIISLEVFRKIIAQTGVAAAPSYNVQSGNVVMKRAEFRKLINKMKTTASTAALPPFDYLITKAQYNGKMKQKNTDFSGDFTLHVLKKDKFLKIPLLPSNIAISDLQVDGKKGLIVSENGYHHVILTGEGKYEVSLKFAVKSSLKKGPHKLDLSIKRTPITVFNLELPLAEIDVEIPQAQQIKTERKKAATQISAVIAQGNHISVRWRKKVAVTEKIPAKLYSEVNHLISIEDDALKINSEINYNILHSEVEAVRLKIPEDMNILSVYGEGIGEWQETKQQNQRILYVPFTYGKKGSVIINVTTETPIAESVFTKVFSGIEVLDAVRETGYIGIELNTSAEVIVKENSGMEKIAVQKLPGRLTNRSRKPLIMGFKYLKHPYNLVLDIKKHEKIGVPVATINSANAVTLFTEDGKVVHRIIYQIRNSAKQFLEIKLPENADVWSVFVDNKPVESSMNGKGKLLVPLIRSKLSGNRLKTFPLEIIYCIVQDNFTVSGSKSSVLPTVDLLTSQMMWSVYLPNDYSFLYFNSTLEKEDIIRGLNIFSGSQRQYDESVLKDVGRARRKKEMKKVYSSDKYKSSFRNIPQQEEQVASQMDAEMEFSDRLQGLSEQDAPQPGISSSGTATGVMPIHIEVPTGGQVYRFAKTIIKPEDPLNFEVFYVRMGIINSIKWLGISLLIILMYIFRTKLNNIRKTILKKVTPAANWVTEIIHKYSKSLKSPAFTFAMLGLVIVFFYISYDLTILFFLMFWLSLVYQCYRYLKNRSKRKEKQAAETVKGEATSEKAEKKTE